MSVWIIDRDKGLRKSRLEEGDSCPFSCKGVIKKVNNNHSWCTSGVHMGTVRALYLCKSCLTGWCEDCSLDLYIY
jgi:hypothetical protein